MVPITMVSSSYFVPEKRGGALADPRPGSENTTLWELRWVKKNTLGVCERTLIRLTSIIVNEILGLVCS